MSLIDVINKIADLLCIFTILYYIIMGSKMSCGEACVQVLLVAVIIDPQGEEVNFISSLLHIECKNLGTITTYYVPV